MIALQAFVESVDGDRFEARFATPKGEVVWAEMRVDMVPEEDRDLIAPGAYFSWTLGDDGTSIVAFSREVFTKEDLERAVAEAENLCTEIKWV